MILVDEPRWPAHGTLWAHLVSDLSLDELHAFAARVGLPRRAFDLDHYDVAADRLDELVRAGARQVTGRELVSRLAASGLRVRGRDRPAARRADLARRWDMLLPGTAQIGAELLERWHEPHRAYHGPGHLAHVLRSVQVAAGGAPVPREVLLALWFHDAVHHGGVARPDGRVPDGAGRREARGAVVGTDEERSADLAARLLAPTVAAGLLTPDDVAEVRRLVLLTATHDPEPADRSGALVCDADLAVLGGAPESYARYVAQVRAEYAHVPDAAFRAGRAAVLRGLLALPRLFTTPEARRRWEDAARANLATELGRLAPPVP